MFWLDQQYLSVKTASTQENVEIYHQSIQDSPFGHKINKDHLYHAEKSYTGHINIQWSVIKIF